MQVKIYTDGAARGNPDGPGGYGAVLQYIDTKGQLHERELSRGYKKNYKQPDGADGSYRSSGGTEPSLPGGAVFRFQISGRCLQSALDRFLAEKELETWQKRKCEECRSLENAF